MAPARNIVNDLEVPSPACSHSAGRHPLIDTAADAPYRTQPPTHEEAGVMAADDSLSSANERTLELVTSVQERILEATRSYVSAVSGVVPETSSWVPSPPEDLPSAKDLLEETFKFQAQLGGEPELFAGFSRSVARGRPAGAKSDGGV